MKRCFTEIQHDAKYKSIGYREIENLDYSIVRPRRELSACHSQIFEPDLNRWELTPPATHRYVRQPITRSDR